MQVPDNVVSGVVTCTGSRVRLPDVPCRLVYLQAKGNNSAAITVGGDTITSGVGGMVLTAGEKLPALLVDNLNRLYVFGANNDILHYMVIR